MCNGTRSPVASLHGPDTVTRMRGSVGCRCAAHGDLPCPRDTAGPPPPRSRGDCARPGNDSGAEGRRHPFATPQDHACAKRSPSEGKHAGRRNRLKPISLEVRARAATGQKAFAIQMLPTGKGYL